MSRLLHPVAIIAPVLKKELLGRGDEEVDTQIELRVRRDESVLTCRCGVR